MPYFRVIMLCWNLFVTSPTGLNVQSLASNGSKWAFTNLNFQYVGIKYDPIAEKYTMKLQHGWTVAQNV